MSTTVEDEQSGPFDLNITSEPLSVDRSIHVVRKNTRGGLCVFIGQVRNHNRGQTILGLEYECYQSMATKVLTSIVENAVVDIEDVGVAVEHRIGDLKVGDDAVVIAVATPHRKEAFAICREIIEELKKHVPIWKKEFDEGGGVWLGKGP